MCSNFVPKKDIAVVELVKAAKDMVEKIVPVIAYFDLLRDGNDPGKDPNPDSLSDSVESLKEAITDAERSE